MLEQHFHLPANAPTCEEFLHTFTIKICVQKKTGWKWNYYIVIVLTSKACRAHPHRLPTYIAAMPIHSYARIQVQGNTNTKGLQQSVLPVKPTQPPTPGTT